MPYLKKSNYSNLIQQRFTSPCYLSITLSPEALLPQSQRTWGWQSFTLCLHPDLCVRGITERFLRSFCFGLKLIHIILLITHCQDLLHLDPQLISWMLENTGEIMNIFDHPISVIKIKMEKIGPGITCPFISNILSS